MNPSRSPFKPRSAVQRGLLWVTAGAATFGVGLGLAGLASAESSTSTTTVAASSASTGSSTTATSDTLAPPAAGQQVDPASLPNGPGETVLTGDTAAKVTAAAEAAEPGATVIRVETDSSGHAYEAHVKLADGTYKTLYFTSSYAADGSDTGFGPGGPGGMGRHGGDHDGDGPAAQAGSGSTGSSTTTNG